MHLNIFKNLSFAKQNGISVFLFGIWCLELVIFKVEDKTFGGGYLRGYKVSCPALPGCHFQSDTIEETLKNIKDAIQGYVAHKTGDTFGTTVDTY